MYCHFIAFLYSICTLLLFLYSCILVHGSYTINIFFIIDSQFCHCLFVQSLQWNFVLKVHWKVNVLKRQNKSLKSGSDLPRFLRLPTSLCWIRAARGHGLETCLVLYSPYLAVFALQLPPQCTQLLLPHAGQKEGLVRFTPRPDDQPPPPHYKQTTRRGLRC